MPVGGGEGSGREVLSEVPSMNGFIQIQPNTFS